MCKLKFIIALLIFSILIVPKSNFAQKPKKFTLVVKSASALSEQINIGEAYFEESYRTAIIKNNSAEFKNGQYSFTGELLYPTAVRIFGGNGTTMFNELIFIEAGFQEMEMNVKDSVVFVLKRPGTNIDNEYMQFLKFVKMDVLNSTMNDSIRKLPLELFEKYLQINPASYIALFALIDHTFFNDFDLLIKEIARHFDPVILKTKGFRFFESEYLIQKQIPALLVKDSKDKSIHLKFENKTGKYTLLEYWFASCKWCKPVMKEINEKYYDALFDKVIIIGISTDPKKLVPNSMKVLKSLNMKWENYWDYEATETSKHTKIYTFPGNLLIDNKGNIIGKNVDLSQIDLLLPRQINTGSK